MKYEFVEFYPDIPIKSKLKPSRQSIGTIHIYLVDIGLDIRGIRIVKLKKGFMYLFPQFKGIDQDTNEPVRYPFMHFTQEKPHRELMEWLHKDVSKLLEEKLKLRGKK